LSGSELLYLLGKHGYRAKIDIKEAKKLLGSRERSLINKQTSGTVLTSKSDLGWLSLLERVGRSLLPGR